MHLTLSLAILGLTLYGHQGLAQPAPASLRSRPRQTSSEAIPGGLTPSPGISPAYTFTVLDFPGTLQTAGFSLNSGAASTKMQIVGATGSNADPGPIGYRGGFLLHYAKTKTSITEIYSPVNYPGTTQQAASAVNDLGQVVGYYADSSSAIHGYSESGGVFTQIDVPFSGATGTGAFGINNSGQIVGYWRDASTDHGFLLSGGTYTTIDYPGAVFTYANAINNLGDVVGFYGDAGGVYHGFLLSKGIYTPLDAPGSTATEANGINDAGNIVGLYCLTAECAVNFDTFQGFVLVGGVYSPITIPGATSTGALGINNTGIIVGLYFDSVGNHAILVVPK
jgi:probable HAF family extracellular repeat protein